MPLDTRFDKRLIERNLRKGIITEQDLQKHIDALPDVSAKSIPLTPPAPTPKPAPIYRAPNLDDDDDDEDDEDDEDE
jgi:hypothetical protein